MKTKMKKFFLETKRLYYKWAYNNKFRSAKWRWPYYDVKYGIGNLIAYFKIIWSDRDWDHSYFLVMVEKKLARMEENMRENSNHTTALRDADNIHKTRLAINRILKDEYHENVYVNHDKKWGDSDFRFTPHQVNESGEPLTYELHIDRANATTFELKDQERKEYRRLIKKPDHLKKQDLVYATKMINKYLFSWWD